MPRQIGTVEILQARTYPMDPDGASDGTEVVVMPGVFPLYRDGFKRYWMMTGKINRPESSDMGEGWRLITDVPSGAAVTFPSRRFSRKGWRFLLAQRVCEEGHPEQRLRITIGRKVVA